MSGNYSQGSPLINLDDSPKRQRPIRSSSLASDLGLYSPSIASSLAPPSHAPLQLTPLRAHYLKRELVTLEFVRELSALDSPGALSVLGSPFLPKSRFINGVPQPAPPAGSPEALEEQRNAESNVDLPFLRFVFHHFVLSFPFLVGCPPTFYSHKLQPFVYSFVSRNISSSDEREGETKRKKIAGKVEKHLGLILSAAIKLTENGGREEVVRVEDDGSVNTGLPASQQQSGASARKRGAPIRAEAKEEDFSINVVSVRNTAFKGRVRTTMHEEFLVRTRRKGRPDVYVARRYGDFVRLAETLRKECIEEDVKGPPPKDRRAVEMKAPSPDVPGSPLSSYPSRDDASSSSGSASGTPNPTFEPNHLPSLARERNRLTLRAYLRSLLHNPVLASSSAFQSFLVESPIVLTPREEQDVLIRDEMDRIREQEARSFRNEVEERVEELEGYLRGFREELVKHDGLTRVFATIRKTERVEDLPIEYRKVLEWARISLASTIYQLFLGSDNSSSVFSQLKRMHGLMPYFMLRGILKISNPVAMVRSVLDLFLARPFGSTSLLQKMFSSGLSDEVKDLKEDAEMVARKIGDDRLCEKVRQYINLDKESQDEMRADAAAENLDIMTVILRSPSQPRLDARTMQRLAHCAVAYDEYKYHRDHLSDPDEDEGPDNDEAWLYEDLHVYRRVMTKARDKEQLIELIFEGSTSELLKDIVTIFYEPLAKVYKAANIADSLSDLQTFLNDLIKTVEYAEDANLVDPQRTVQIFVDLVARHEARFYNFVHQVHSKGEGLFDNLMAWIELFINFVRDGLPSPISLDFLLPVGGQEREAVLQEVDAIVEYHRRLKLAHHERMTKRLAKGRESERDADAAFVANVMDNLHISGMMDDVNDVEAEGSEDEAQEEEGEASSDDENEQAPKPAWKSNNPFLKAVPSPPPRKKDRAPIDPPKLVHIPKLVPLFVELVRTELGNARRQQRLTFCSGIMVEARNIRWVLKGTIVSSRPDRSLSILEASVLVVDKDGFIAQLEAASSPASLAVLQMVQRGEVSEECFVELGRDAWLLPGFVDTHIHAPQYVNAGMALDKPLMEWLEHYTFRAESRIDQDPQGLGKKVYEKLVQRLLENGTTAASVFGTISVEANLVLAACFLRAGLRGQIGKVAMDQHSIPSYLETTSSSLSDTREFVSAMRSLVADLPPRLQLVEPVVTPRFVPTCSIELLKGLAEIAKSENLRLQSHMCESQGMVDVCKEMLGGKSDVELLNELGLLNSTALMAHCTHSSQSDLALLAETGTSIAHCPLANVYFSAERQLPLREAWTAGVKVGLGSDISGGYRVGLDENMRWAVGVSRLRDGARQAAAAHEPPATTSQETLEISWKESLYLATLGGAQALGLDVERQVGTLEVGAAFDAQWIQVGGPRSRVDWFDLEGEKKVTMEEKLEKWWCNGSEADRRAVWVQGRRVYEQ
ncbi:hypothetical protein JCM5296_003068 [Sporobolomyces johnsonii]